MAETVGEDDTTERVTLLVITVRVEFCLRMTHVIRLLNRQSIWRELLPPPKS